MVITAIAYTGIVIGSEHEFMNNGTSTLTLSAGSGVTVRSVGSKTKVTQYGAAVLKYIDTNTFALIGALE